MGIQFNGNVTINGNVEMYDNGSVKITANQLNININDLSKFIEKNLEYSTNKSDYLEVAGTLQTSTEPEKIKSAVAKLKEMAKEVGKNVMFSGLSQAVIEVIKKMIGQNGA